ncbi:hypothetical protein [Nostoc favosum]|uniref:Uncharacterized protein n=1 Tax=Nostoc favosum CHAB5714 TaxID=2780399 RepID=A0ABS8I870_9NOSO|nr:hypothetical protein [Nostoc favosum]MCC5600402.1 hypothetical protein [Nostoc favosum CHAB5714]
MSGSLEMEVSHKGNIKVLRAGEVLQVPAGVCIIVPILAQVVMLAMSTMVTERLVSGVEPCRTTSGILLRAASRREVRATPTHFCPGLPVHWNG